MLLSIVIPTYNGAKTISECLRSISNNFSKCKNQLEIIVVDDGSTDNTLEEVKKFSFNNFKVISKENGGVSSARNAGIEVATGKYIWFIDSDDYLANFDGNKLLDFIKSNISVDMFLFGFYKKTTKNSGKIVINNEEKILNHTEFTEKFASIFEENEFNVPWNRINRRSIIIDNKIQFDQQLKTGEDAVFNSEIVKYLEKVCVINRPLYVYNLFYSKGRKGYDPKLHFNLFQLSSALKDLVESQRIDSSFFWNKYERMNYTLLANLAQKCSDYGEFKRQLKKELLPAENVNFSKLELKAKVFYLLIKFNWLAYQREKG